MPRRHATYLGAILLSTSQMPFALLASGALLELWVISCVVWPPGNDIPRHVALFIAAWLCYALAVGMVLRLRSAATRSDLLLIFGLAVALRAPLLFTTPTLSDDVFRSVWDARVMHAGINPYLYPPAADELARLRDELIWPRVNAQQQRTPYPPLAELSGAVAYAILPERPLAFQALAALADLLSAGLLAWLLARVGLDPRRSLVVAWSPAGVLHFAHSGHNDSLMVALLVTAALFLTFGKRWLSMAALAGATLVKAVPALAGPAFIRQSGWASLVAAIATAALMCAPFAAAGSVALSGLFEEGGEARFNDSFHWVLERLFSVGVGEAGNLWASAVGLAAVLTGSLVFARYASSPLQALTAGSRVLGLYLLVAAAVQPWYLTWLGPLMAVSLRAGKGLAPFGMTDGVAWLWLGGASILTDLTYLPGGAVHWPWIRAVEYVPLYVLLGMALISWRRERVPH